MLGKSRNIGSHNKRKMISSGINLVMTVIGFAVSTLFIVFVCTRLVCARIHLNASRRSLPVIIASRSHLNLLERGLHGLEPIAVANFPTKKYSDEFFSAAEDSQCSVCLSEYHGEDILRILPFCGHAFHVNCIDIWLQQHSTCPVCRVSLHEFPERKHLMQPLYASAVRSQYSTGTFDSHAYHCMSANNRFSPRADYSQGRDPIRENSIASEGNIADAGENVAQTCLDDQIMKDTGSKHVESPSYT